MSAKNFVWYELLTTDVGAALAFYRGVLGWTTEPFPGEGGQDYMICLAHGRGVGGVMARPEGAPYPPFWLGYIGTQDIDGDVARFAEGGGTVHRGPWDIPNVGRLAVVGDPQGAALAFIQGPADRKSEAFDPGKPGHGAWHEYHAADLPSAVDFYSGQMGWTKGEAMDMGPSGIYQIFKSGETQIGGMVRGMPGVPPSWVYYFATESVGAAAGRVRDGGGTIVVEPCQIPGGGWILMAKDPQGAFFALVGSA